MRLRWFPPLLRFLLAGYFLFSKPFAYLHLPGTPLFVGEIVLVIGITEALWRRASLRRLITTSPALKMVAVFMGWCAVRLVTSLVSSLGPPMDAIRDSAIWYYGAFTFLVVTVVVHDPAFTARFLNWFRRLLPWFVVWAPIAVVGREQSTVFVPGSSVLITAVKPGDMAVNCAMVVAFVWLGLDGATGHQTKPSRRTWLVILGLLGLVVAGSQTRGGFLAGVVVLGATFFLLPRRRRQRVISSTVPLLALLIALLAIWNPTVHLHRREVSLTQLSANVTSIFGGGSQELSGTEEWRKTLWLDVARDAVSSQYLLEGQGFGPNVYQRYRGGNQDARGDTPLRSPHNSHLNILARSGLPGCTLWLALWIVWFRSSIRVIRRRDGAVSPLQRNLVVWLSASVLGLLVNAFFDPSLEGPQAGVWLWTLVGLGAVHFRAMRTPVVFSTTSRRHRSGSAPAPAGSHR